VDLPWIVDNNFAITLRQNVKNCALAALAAVSAASAQSTVTLYGVVDAGYTNKDSKTAMKSNGLSTSRIGFKGTEDLGGGLTALFVVETAVNTATPAPTSIGDRGAFVGVAGGFGTVTMGAGQLTPSFYATAATNAVAADNYGLKQYAGASRVNNVVNYTSPTILGGLTLRGAMIQKADNGTAAKASSDISAIYANGPLTIAASASDNGFDKGTYVGAAYNLGMVKVFASRVDTAATDVVAAVANGPGVAGSKAVAAAAAAKYNNFGVSVPVNAALTLAAEYSQQKDADKDTYLLSAQYALSKRTTAYAYTSKVEKKDSLVGLGVRHSF
jgi:predicted porin